MKEKEKIGNKKIVFIIIKYIKESKSPIYILSIYPVLSYLWHDAVGVPLEGVVLLGAVGGVALHDEVHAELDAILHSQITAEPLSQSIYHASSVLACEARER